MTTLLSDNNVLWLFAIVIVIMAGFIWYSLKTYDEGFDDLNTYGPKGDFIMKFLPKRGDVGENEEEKGYTRDPRFFADYADVQRIGAKNDFCRMIEPGAGSDPESAFFACALAGTENLSGTEYRTETVKEGFRRSRDDYMHDIDKSGREAYCRILKSPDGTFQALCRKAQDRKFGKTDVIDTSPPKEIKMMLDFYDGIMMWLRMRDDLVDYAGNLLVSTAGDITINEEPNKNRPVEGLHFLGGNQFLRLGENHSMEFSEVISMRAMRAVSCWVYFDEFSNNAHIFDFGSGAGKNNVFLGIVGRGNPTVQSDTIRPDPCNMQSTVPDPPSGAQLAPMMSPQHLMETTSANVDEFTCPGPEIVGRRVAPLISKAAKPKGPRAPQKGRSESEPGYAWQGPAVTADLIYEIWDSEQRKMRITIPNAVRLKQWTHVCITAASMDAFRPDLNVYINGCFVFKHPSGFLPQTSFMTHNYIGKSNWQDVTSQYDNRDEPFKGYMFDFRVYNKPMPMRKVQETVKWGASLLQIPLPKSLEENLQALEKQDKVVPVNELSNASPLLGDSGILIMNPPF